MEESYQSNLQQQMQAHLKSSSGGSAELKEMSQATANLQQVALANARQGQVVAQAIQQQQMQIQQLSQSVQQLLVQMRMQGAAAGAPMQGHPPLPPSATLNMVPPPPMMAAPSAIDRIRTAGGKAADFGSFMVKDMGSQLANFSKDYARQSASDAIDYARQFQRPPAAHNTGFAGEVGLGQHQHGFLPMARHSIGSFYDPAAFKSMNYAAHQRAIQTDLGNKASDLGYGMLNFGLSGMTASGYLGGKGAMAGMALGSALGPVGSMVGLMGGAMAGSAVGDKLAPISPVDNFLEKIQMNAYYGAQAQQGAHGFLRGRAGFQTGRFDITEESRIGQGVRRGMLNELTLDQSDISDFSQGAASGGMFLGVQNSEQYVSQFKRQLSTAKSIMKIAGVAMTEATEIMASAQQIMGVTGGADTQRLMASIHSFAPLAGLGFSDMIGVAQQGATSYGQQGMSAQMGARQAVQSRALAGMGATFTMDRGTLASAGGEVGVAGIIGHTANQYLQGAGGQMLGISGRGYADFGQGIGSAAGAMQTSGDMVSFLANRRTRTERAVEGMGPMGLQIQQARDLMQLADEYEGIGGTKEERMKLLAKSQYGLNDAQADALISSFMALPEAMDQQQNVSRRQLNDSLQEGVKERYSIKSRLKLGAREFFEGDTQFGTRYGIGIGAAANATSDALAHVGQSVQYGSRDLFDKMSGIERGYVNEEVHKEIMKTEDLSYMDRGAGLGGGSGVDRKALRERASHIRENTSMGRVIDQAIESSRNSSPAVQRMQVEAVNWAIQSGRTFESADQMFNAFKQERVGVGSGGRASTMTDAEVVDVGTSLGFDTGTMTQIAKQAGLHAAYDAPKFASTKDVANNARSMFAERDAGSFLGRGLEGAFKGSTKDSSLPSRIAGDIRSIGAIDGTLNAVGGRIDKTFTNLISDDAELEGAMSSKKFQEAVTFIQALYRDYDPVKGTNQGKQWEARAKEAGKLISQVEDPKSQALLQQMLKNAGITVTKGGQVSFEGTIQMMRGQVGGGGFFETQVDRELQNQEVQAALKEYSMGVSIEDIAKNNTEGAEFLRNRERRGIGGLRVGVGFLGDSATGARTKESFDAVNMKAKYLPVAEAAHRGLLMFGSGDEAKQSAHRAANLVDRESGSMDLIGAGQAFGDLSEEELNRMFKDGSAAERQVAMAVTKFQKGDMSEEDLGNKVLSLMAQTGSQGGDVVKGAKADAVLMGEEVAGSEAVKSMVTSLSTQTAINQKVLEELKRMRGL